MGMNLHEACTLGVYNKVEWMLRYGADPNITDSDGRTPLHDTIRTSRETIAQLLLNHGANPNAGAIGGWTPLHEACRDGNQLIVRLLLTNQADPNAATETLWTPLHEACKMGHSSLFVFLVTMHHADKDARDCEGRTPLHVACQHGHTKSVAALLRYGAKPHVEDNKGLTPLRQAFKNENETMVLQFLESKTYQHFRTQDGWTPLQEACEKEYVAVVKLLLKDRANHNATAADGKSLLFVACKNNFDCIVQLLLEHRAEPNVFAVDGWTPLHEACRNGNEPIVSLLLAREAYVNARNKDWRTCLHEACESGCDSIVDLLLAKKANPNATSKNGMAPLHLACKKGSVGVVELLLTRGAKWNAAAKDGSTPLHEACKNGNESIVELLLSQNAEPNVTKGDGRTPLHEACENQHYPVVGLLLKYKANPTARSNDGRVPVDLACKNDSIVELLLRHAANPNLFKDEGPVPLLFVVASAPNDTRRGCTSIDARFDHSSSTRAVVSVPIVENGDNRQASTPAMVTELNPTLIDAWRSRMLETWRKFANVPCETGGNHFVFVARLQAMNDNLVEEALASGFKVEEVVHAIFFCQESRVWLHNFLLVHLQLNETLVSKILQVLHGGRILERENFADALVHFSKDSFRVSLATQCDALDLSVYTEAPWLYVEDARMDALKHLNGVYQIKGSRITCALEPQNYGVKYYIHKDCLDLVEKNSPCHNLFHKSGKDPHRVQTTVDLLVSLGCDLVIAWRLLANVQSSMNVDDLCDKVVQAFRIVSNFRTQLKKAVETRPKGKRLFGSKAELCQNRHDQKPAACFVLASTVYLTAQQNCGLDINDPLEPFTTDLFSFCAMQFHMELISKFVEKAKESDVNKGKAKRATQHFDALALALLGGHNNGQIPSDSGFLRCEQTQFCYANDESDTKGFYTPFSNLIIVATYYDGRMLYHQVQHLECESSSLTNWIALRAALEFVVDIGERFPCETLGLERATELFKESLAEFIKDASNAFLDMTNMMYRSLPTTVSVSRLRRLCDVIAKVSGASSPWLVREMISKCIAKCADITGPEEFVGYGMMEITMKQNKRFHSDTLKVVDFDEKVSLEGVLCRTNKNGRLCLREHRSGRVGSQIVLNEGRMEVMDEDFCDVFPDPAFAIGNVWV